MYDIEEKQLKAAEESVVGWLKSMESDDLLRGQKAEDVMKRISFKGDLREVIEGAVYVQVKLTVT